MTRTGAPAIDRAITVWRNPDLLVAEVDGEVVMMNVEVGEYYGLDDIGSDLWNRLAAPVTVDALLTALEADYEAAPGVIERDVNAILADMAARNLVRIAA